MAPQPFGPMGVVADLFAARRRRCSGIDFLLATKPGEICRLTPPINRRTVVCASDQGLSPRYGVTTNNISSGTR